MRLAVLGLGSALAFSLLSVDTANAQRVQADIRIGGHGPISGHIRIGGRDRWDYRRDYRPRKVRVEVYRRFDRGRHHGWFNKWRRNARTVVVYYDRGDDCYYDRFRPGLREYRVYERDGRYVRWEDDNRYDDRYGRGRYDDYYGRDRDERYDDRYDDRRDRVGRYDPRDGRYDPRERRADRDW